MRGMRFNGQKASPEEAYAFAKNDFVTMQEHFCNYPELKKLKNEIEWDVFWKIVKEISAKSGIDYKHLNKLGKDSILGINDISDLGDEQYDVTGAYLPNLNAVLIDYNVIKKYSTQYNVSEKMVAIDSIFHEFVHSLSNVKISEKQLSSNNDTVAIRSTDMGYFTEESTIASNRDKVVYQKESEKFRLVNEAVTQGIAKEIFDQYIQRTGSFSKKEIEDYHENYYDAKINIYNFFVNNLKKICDVVGEKAGVQGDVVWKGFVRGIFYHKPLEDATVKKWFANAFSETFLSELAYITSLEEFTQLIEKYKLG